jgi:molecular chaperone GrpE
MRKTDKSMESEKRGGKSGKKHAENISAEERETSSVKDESMKKKGGSALDNDKESLQEEKEKLQGESMQEVEKLEAQLKEKEEKYLRLAAEFDNYRKRTLREKAELTRYIAGDIISDMLPVIDDLDRAIDSVNSAKDLESMQKGIKLIYDKFGEFLKQKGVKEIQAMGSDFDTDLHEAITKITAPSKKEKGKIVDVIQKGYLLHDKVIRYAKVVIGE